MWWCTSPYSYCLSFVSVIPITGVQVLIPEMTWHYSISIWSEPSFVNISQPLFCFWQKSVICWKKFFTTICSVFFVLWQTWLGYSDFNIVSKMTLMHKPRNTVSITVCMKRWHWSKTPPMRKVKPLELWCFSNLIYTQLKCKNGLGFGQKNWLLGNSWCYWLWNRFESSLVQL